MQIALLSWVVVHGYEEPCPHWPSLLNTAMQTPPPLEQIDWQVATVEL